MGHDRPISSFNVTEFGALAADGGTDTPAISRAIHAASTQGGGTVFFPAGRYLSSSIELKSNITLYLDAGCVLEAVDPEIEAYELPEPNTESAFQDFGHSHWKNSLIWGIDLANVSIIGPGLIYGKGLISGFYRFADRSKGEQLHKDGGPGTGNKSIALKNCRNVTLRDFSVLHGGHFAILATGVSNLTIDNLKIDTNRDGVDIDACQNVRVTNCSINSPWDDGICLKTSYALGELRPCENVTISDCFLAGNFVEGTLLDGTFEPCEPQYRSYENGRIKLGTESNGDFRNITITNCVFESSKGIAIESVDGSQIEDVSISNITMRDVRDTPVFIRLGSRLRGPEGTRVGAIRRISIDNLVCSSVAMNWGTIFSGIPGHRIETIRLSNWIIHTQGGGQMELRDVLPPEREQAYPEPRMFGDMPTYGFFFRHAEDIALTNVKLSYQNPEARPAVGLTDVIRSRFRFVDFQPSSIDQTLFDLREIADFRLDFSENSAGLNIEACARRKVV